MILITLKFSLDFNHYSKFSIACFGTKKKNFKNKKQKKTTNGTKLCIQNNYYWKLIEFVFFENHSLFIYIKSLRKTLKLLKTPKI